MAIQWKKERLPFWESLIEVEMVVAFRDRTTQNVTDCPAYCWQGIRNGVLRAVPSAMALRKASYLKAVPRVVEDLLTAFSDRGVKNAALVVPPSARNDVRPYADALLKTDIATVDLSGCVKRESIPRFALVNRCRLKKYALRLRLSNRQRPLLSTP